MLHLFLMLQVSIERLAMEISITRHCKQAPPLQLKYDPQTRYHPPSNLPIPGSLRCHIQLITPISSPLAALFVCCNILKPAIVPMPTPHLLQSNRESLLCLLIG